MFSDLSPAIWLHFVTASAALLIGAVLLAGRKGTRFHRALGMAYIASMATTLATAAVEPATVMPFLFGRFGFFHVFVAMGAVSLGVGIWALLRWRATRDPGWLKSHQINLAYSYVGLLMAGISQFAVNPRFGLIEALTPPGFWTLFAIVNLATYAIASILITTRIARADPLRFSRP